MKTHITAPDGQIGWRYEPAPNTGSKVLLLTIGRIAVIGCWQGRLGEHFLAWSPLPKRDKAKELGIRMEQMARETARRL